MEKLPERGGEDSETRSLRMTRYCVHEVGKMEELNSGIILKPFN